MNTQLTYIIAQQRSAELQRAGADARLASEVRAGQPNPRHPKKKHLWVDTVSADLASGPGAAAGRGPWQSWMAVAAILVGAGWEIDARARVRSRYAGSVRRNLSVKPGCRGTSTTRCANPPPKGNHMISPEFTIALAQAKWNGLRRAADARITPRRAQPGGVATEGSVTLRCGSPADQAPLARLAELDSSTPPAQSVLLAEVNGQLRAALALTDGTVVADPFHPTAELIDLLGARARQLAATPRIRRSRRLRSWSRPRALPWS